MESFRDKALLMANEILEGRFFTVPFITRNFSMTISQLGFVIFVFETDVEQNFDWDTVASARVFNDELCPTSFDNANCDCEAHFMSGLVLEHNLHICREHCSPCYSNWNRLREQSAFNPQGLLMLKRLRVQDLRVFPYPLGAFAQHLLFMTITVRRSVSRSVCKKRNLDDE